MLYSKNNNSFINSLFYGANRAPFFISTFLNLLVRKNEIKRDIARYSANICKIASALLLATIRLESYYTFCS